MQLFHQTILFFTPVFRRIFMKVVNSLIHFLTEVETISMRCHLCTNVFGQGTQILCRVGPQQTVKYTSHTGKNRPTTLQGLDCIFKSCSFRIIFNRFVLLNLLGKPSLKCRSKMLKLNPIEWWNPKWCGVR